MSVPSNKTYASLDQDENIPPHPRHRARARSRIQRAAMTSSILSTAPINTNASPYSTFQGGVCQPSTITSEIVSKLTMSASLPSPDSSSSSSVLNSPTSYSDRQTPSHSHRVPSNFFPTSSAASCASPSSLSPSIHSHNLHPPHPLHVLPLQPSQPSPTASSTRSPLSPHPSRPLPSVVISSPHCPPQLRPVWPVCSACGGRDPACLAQIPLPASMALPVEFHGHTQPLTYTHSRVHREVLTQTPESVDSGVPADPVATVAPLVSTCTRTTIPTNTAATGASIAAPPSACRLRRPSAHSPASTAPAPAPDPPFSLASAPAASIARAAVLLVRATITGVYRPCGCVCTAGTCMYEPCGPAQGVSNCKGSESGTDDSERVDAVYGAATLCDAMADAVYSAASAKDIGDRGVVFAHDAVYQPHTDAAHGVDVPILVDPDAVDAPVDQYGAVYGGDGIYAISGGACADGEGAEGAAGDVAVSAGGVDVASEGGSSGGGGNEEEEESLCIKEIPHTYFRSTSSSSSPQPASCRPASSPCLLSEEANSSLQALSSHCRHLESFLMYAPTPPDHHSRIAHAHVHTRRYSPICTHAGVGASLLLHTDEGVGVVDDVVGDVVGAAARDVHVSNNQPGERQEDKREELEVGGQDREEKEVDARMSIETQERPEIVDARYQKVYSATSGPTVATTTPATPRPPATVIHSPTPPPPPRSSPTATPAAPSLTPEHLPSLLLCLCTHPLFLPSLARALQRLRPTRAYGRDFKLGWEEGTVLATVIGVALGGKWMHTCNPENYNFLEFPEVPRVLCTCAVKSSTDVCVGGVCMEAAVCDALMMLDTISVAPQPHVPTETCINDTNPGPTNAAYITSGNSNHNVDTDSNDTNDTAIVSDASGNAITSDTGKSTITGIAHVLCAAPPASPCAGAPQLPHDTNTDDVCVYECGNGATRHDDGRSGVDRGECADDAATGTSPTVVKIADVTITLSATTYTDTSNTFHIDTHSRAGTGAGTVNHTTPTHLHRQPPPNSENDGELTIPSMPSPSYCPPPSQLSDLSASAPSPSIPSILSTLSARASTSASSPRLSAISTSSASPPSPLTITDLLSSSPTLASPSLWLLLATRSIFPFLLNKWETHVAVARAKRMHAALQLQVAIEDLLWCIKIRKIAVENQNFPGNADGVGNNIRGTGKLSCSSASPRPVRSSPAPSGHAALSSLRTPLTRTPHTHTSLVEISLAQSPLARINADPYAHVYIDTPAPDTSSISNDPVSTKSWKSTHSSESSKFPGGSNFPDRVVSPEYSLHACLGRVWHACRLAMSTVVTHLDCVFKEIPGLYIRGERGRAERRAREGDAGRNMQQCPQPPSDHQHRHHPRHRSQCSHASTLQSSSCTAHPCQCLWYDTHKTREWLRVLHSLRVWSGPFSVLRPLLLDTRIRLHQYQQQHQQQHPYRYEQRQCQQHHNHQSPLQHHLRSQGHPRHPHHASQVRDHQRHHSLARRVWARACTRWRVSRRAWEVAEGVCDEWDNDLFATDDSIIHQNSSDDDGAEGGGEPWNGSLFIGQQHIKGNGDDVESGLFDAAGDGGSTAAVGGGMGCDAAGRDESRHRDAGGSDRLGGESRRADDNKNTQLRTSTSTHTIPASRPTSRYSPPPSPLIFPSIALLVAARLLHTLASEQATLRRGICTTSLALTHAAGTGIVPRKAISSGPPVSACVAVLNVAPEDGQRGGVPTRMHASEHATLREDTCACDATLGHAQTSDTIMARRSVCAGAGVCGDCGADTGVDVVNECKSISTGDTHVDSTHNEDEWKSTCDGGVCACNESICNGNGCACVDTHADNNCGCKNICIANGCGCIERAHDAARRRSQGVSDSGDPDDYLRKRVVAGRGHVESAYDKDGVDGVSAGINGGGSGADVNAGVGSGGGARVAGIAMPITYTTPHTYASTSTSSSSSSSRSCVCIRRCKKALALLMAPLWPPAHTNADTSISASPASSLLSDFDPAQYPAMSVLRSVCIGMEGTLRRRLRALSHAWGRGGACVCQHQQIHTTSVHSAATSTSSAVGTATVPADNIELSNSPPTVYITDAATAASHTRISAANTIECSNTSASTTAAPRASTDGSAVAVLGAASNSALGSSGASVSGCVLALTATTAIGGSVDPTTRTGEDVRNLGASGDGSSRGGGVHDRSGSRSGGGGSVGGGGVGNGGVGSANGVRFRVDHDVVGDGCDEGNGSSRRTAKSKLVTVADTGRDVNHHDNYDELDGTCYKSDAERDHNDITIAATDITGSIASAPVTVLPTPHTITTSTSTSASAFGPAVTPDPVHIHVPIPASAHALAPIPALVPASKSAPARPPTPGTPGTPGTSCMCVEAAVQQIVEMWRNDIAETLGIPLARGAEEGEGGGNRQRQQEETVTSLSSCSSTFSHVVPPMQLPLLSSSLSSHASPRTPPRTSPRILPCTPSRIAHVPALAHSQYTRITSPTSARTPHTPRTPQMPTSTSTSTSTSIRLATPTSAPHTQTHTPTHPTSSSRVPRALPAHAHLLYFSTSPAWRDTRAHTTVNNNANASINTNNSTNPSTTSTNANSAPAAGVNTSHHPQPVAAAQTLLPSGATGTAPSSGTAAGGVIGYPQYGCCATLPVAMSQPLFGVVAPPLPLSMPQFLRVDVGQEEGDALDEEEKARDLREEAKVREREQKQREEHEEAVEAEREGGLYLGGMNAAATATAAVGVRGEESANPAVGENQRMDIGIGGSNNAYVSAGTTMSINTSEDAREDGAEDEYENKNADEVSSLPIASPCPHALSTSSSVRNLSLPPPHPATPPTTLSPRGPCWRTDPAYVTMRARVLSLLHVLAAAVTMEHGRDQVRACVCGYEVGYNECGNGDDCACDIDGGGERRVDPYNGSFGEAGWGHEGLEAYDCHKYGCRDIGANVNEHKGYCGSDGGIMTSVCGCGVIGADNNGDNCDSDDLYGRSCRQKGISQTHMSIRSRISRKFGCLGCGMAGGDGAGTGVKERDHIHANVGSVSHRRVDQSNNTHVNPIDGYNDGVGSNGTGKCARGNSCPHDGCRGGVDSQSQVAVFTPRCTSSQRYDSTIQSAHPTTQHNNTDTRRHCVDTQRTSSPRLHVGNDIDTNILILASAPHPHEYCMSDTHTDVATRSYTHTCTRTSTSAGTGIHASDQAGDVHAAIAAINMDTGAVAAAATGIGVGDAIHSTYCSMHSILSNTVHSAVLNTISPQNSPHNRPQDGFCDSSHSTRVPQRAGEGTREEEEEENEAILRAMLKQMHAQDTGEQPSSNETKDAKLNGADQKNSIYSPLFSPDSTMMQDQFISGNAEEGDDMAAVKVNTHAIRGKQRSAAVTSGNHPDTYDSSHTRTSCNSTGSGRDSKSRYDACINNNSTPHITSKWGVLSLWSSHRSRRGVHIESKKDLQDATELIDLLLLNRTPQ